jgi:hypothetical protein
LYAHQPIPFIGFKTTEIQLRQQLPRQQVRRLERSRSALLKKNVQKTFAYRAFERPKSGRSKAGVSESFLVTSFKK